MLTMKTCNLIVAALTLLIGCLIAWVSYGYGIAMSVFGPEAGFWPFFLGLGLVITALLIFFDTFKRSAQLSSEEIIFISPSNASAYRMMGLVIVYVLLLQLLGFYLDSLLFMITAMYMLGVRSRLLLAGVSVLFLGFVYVLFGMILGITLPVPFFME